MRSILIIPAVLTSLALPLPGQAQTPTKNRQANDCYHAKAAYGGDQAACLIVLYHWEAREARLKALEFEARDRRYADSLARAEEARAAREERRFQADVRDAERFADSIMAARAAEQRTRDSVEYAVGSYAKKELRRIVAAQRDFFSITNSFTNKLQLLILGYEPPSGVTVRILFATDSSWTGQTTSADGWRCTVNGSKTQLTPEPQCERIPR